MIKGLSWFLIYNSNKVTLVHTDDVVLLWQNRKKKQFIKYTFELEKIKTEFVATIIRYINLFRNICIIFGGK